MCLLDRAGTRIQVGYMRWEQTASGGSLAYWAGDATPPDLGLPGEPFCEMGVAMKDEIDAMAIDNPT